MIWSVVVPDSHMTIGVFYVEIVEIRDARAHERPAVALSENERDK